MASRLSVEDELLQLYDGDFADFEGEQDLLRDGSTHGYLPMRRSEVAEALDLLGQGEEEDSDDGGFSSLWEAVDGLRRGKPTLLPS